MLGQVVKGMQIDDPPVEGKKNNPMMPVAWTKSYKGGRVFNTTMGASQDMLTAGTRRMLVNACYWCLGKEEDISTSTKVDIVGTFEPLPFRFGGFQKGVKPADHKL